MDKQTLFEREVLLIDFFFSKNKILNQGVDEGDFTSVIFRSAS